MDLGIAGRTAIVCGGSAGLGRGVATAPGGSSPACDDVGAGSEARTVMIKIVIILYMIYS